MLPADWLCSRIHHQEAMCFAQLECVQTTLHQGLTVRLSEGHYVECRSCSLQMDSKARIDPWLGNLSVHRSEAENTYSKLSHGAEPAGLPFANLPKVHIMYEEGPMRSELGLDHSKGILLAAMLQYMHRYV